MVYEEKYDQPVPPSHKKVVWPKVNKKTNTKKRTNNKKNNNNKNNKKAEKGKLMWINAPGGEREFHSSEEEEEAFSADSDDSSYSP